MYGHVKIGDRLVPNIACPSDPYRTKGQHPQLQPRVRPEVLEKARKQFFGGLFSGELREGEAVYKSHEEI